MTVLQHHYTGEKVAKWAVLLALAGAVALIFLSGVATGFERESSPALLPEAAMEAAEPMMIETESQLVPDKENFWDTTFSTSLQLWNTMSVHNSGNLELATNSWKEIRLPEATAVWKEVALGVLYLDRGNLELSHQHLAAAVEMDAENPVVHYYLGLLRLEQAEKAHQWKDAYGEPKFQLAKFQLTQLQVANNQPLEVTPNSRSMYRMVGMQELENAVKNAANLNAEQCLLPVSALEHELYPPTVKDLLNVIKAGEYHATSHNILAHLNMERGMLECAEEHLVSANHLGADVLYGYHELAAHHEELGNYGKAACIYAKALTLDNTDEKAANKIMENLRKAYHSQ